jgi:hypothetical protein
VIDLLKHPEHTRRIGDRDWVVDRFDWDLLTTPALVLFAKTEEFEARRAS